ncbi:electron transport complex subunit RnfG [mine drainage metagenome]|uniref:Electron transport complex subunit RnfG n=1 Tax=mine drainage metagenome TaxID=410659 RepID=A0A1J5TA16_9ZZZZ
MTTQFVSSTALIRALGLIACICGIIIVGVYEGTLDAVNANKKIALDRQIFKVLPGAKSVQAYDALPGGISPAGDHESPSGAIRFYAAYDATGKLMGIAAEGSSAGYADQVRVLYAYDPDKQVITGLGVITMRETPGIGDKILVDHDFIHNFVALDVALTSDMKTLANAVKTVKHGTKANPWEVDAISGATVTSKAVGRGINQSAAILLPRLVPHISQLRSKS